MAKGVKFEYRAQDKTGAATRSVKGGLAGVNRAALSLRGTLGALGVGILGREVIGQLSGYGKAMSGVQAVTRATDAEMRAMKKTARNLGATTAFSAQQAGEGMEFLGRAGFNAAAILESTPGVLNLAAAGALELGRAADISSNILTAFRLEADQMNRVVDVMAETAASANTNIEQLGEAMKFAAPFAAEFGVTLEETAAAVGVLSDAGLQGTLAGTGLKRVFAELASPSDDLRQHMGGLSLQTHSLSEIMTQLAGSSLSSSQAIDIFGKIAAPAFFNLQAGSKKLEGLSKSLLDVAGTSGRQAQTRMDNLAGAGKQLTSALSELALVAGEAGLTQGLRDLASGITEIARGGEAALVVQNIGTAFKFLVDHKQEIVSLTGAFIALRVATTLMPKAFGKVAAGIIPLVVGLAGGTAAAAGFEKAFGAIGSSNEIDEMIADLFRAERKLAELKKFTLTELTAPDVIATDKGLKGLRDTTLEIENIRESLKGLGVNITPEISNGLESTINNLKKAANSEDGKSQKLFSDRLKALDQENEGLSVGITHRKENVLFEENLLKIRQKIGRELKGDEFEALRKTIGEKQFILSEINEATRKKEFGEITRSLKQENALLDLQATGQKDLIPLIRARFNFENKFGPLYSSENQALDLLIEHQQKLNEEIAANERAANFTKNISAIKFSNEMLALRINGETELADKLEARRNLEEQLGGALNNKQLAAFDAQIEKQKEFNKQLEFQNNLTDAGAGIFDRFGNGVVESLQRGTGAMTAFKNAATAALFDVQRELVKLLIFQPLKNAAVSGLGNIFGAFFSGGSSFGGSLNPQNTGTDFATGGSFKVGGSGGPDSKRFNLNLTPGEMVNISRPGENRSGGNTQVIIHNHSGQPSTTKQSKNSQGGKTIEVMIGEAVAADIRQNGQIPQAMQERFALNDNLVSR